MELQFATPCNMFLDFPTSQSWMFFFFTSTFYFVFPFLKSLYELVLSMFNKHQFVSLGEECAFEICLPGNPT